MTRIIADKTLKDQRQSALSASSAFNEPVHRSRTSNSFQAPLLAKRVGQNLATGADGAAITDFRWLLLSATLASIVGAFFIPTFQRMFAHYVEAFARYRSVPRILARLFSASASSQLWNSIRAPAWKNITKAYFRRSIVWLTGSRIVGTVMAQFLLIPAALLIVTIARWL